MRKFLFGVILTLLILLIYKQCTTSETVVSVHEKSNLIQEQLKNVGKLVVTQGHYSEVFNYENSKEIFGDYLTADKKALVVVNAEVSVSYDLSELEYQIDETNNILLITSIPEEEIKISPELEYYDIQSDFLNPFEAEDYNRIREIVKKSLAQKFQNSKLKTNAKNRLLSELSKIYVLTNSLGWTLQYNEQQINSLEGLEILDLKM